MRNFGLACFVLTFTFGAQAQESIPDALKEWIPWVSDASSMCPLGNGDCAYTSALDLDLDDKGGTFRLVAKRYNAGPLELPGDEKRWPLNVVASNKRLSVIEKNQRPVVNVKAGEHIMNGRFKWNTLPESLTIPKNVALLTLTVRGKRTDLVGRQHTERVFLEQAASDEDVAQKRIDLRVHRKLTDGVPMLLTTQIDLDVSGDAREEKIGPVLPKGFKLMSLSGTLPVEMSDGKLLRVQARPGNHKITVTAIAANEVKEVVFVEQDSAWPNEEIWVFENNTPLRAVRIEAQSVDPSRTQLPNAWRAFPTYRLDKNASIKIVTERRGDENTGSDQLNLSRQLWLDFDGEGFTVRDQIKGTLNSGWRLEAGEGLKLGRVSSEGDDLFITQTGSKRSGVELRTKTLNVDAEGRVKNNKGRLSAVGWAHDFHSVSHTLHLPKGWKLFHASGTDSVTNSWVKEWNPLEFFIVLLFPVFFWRLFGWRWGLISFFSIALLLPEKPELVWALAPILVAEALLRVLPSGAIEKLVRLSRSAVLIGVIIGGVVFAYHHMQQGLHPSLAKSSSSHRSGFNTDLMSNVSNEVGYGGSRSSKGKLSKKKGIEQKQLQVYDPKARLQTGTGLPRWRGSNTRLSFSGPVTKHQEMKLFLISPKINMVLSFVRVFFFALIMFCLAGLPGRRWPKSFRSKHKAWTFFSFALLIPLQANATEIPSPEMLEQLKKRVDAPPACAPKCVDSESLVLNASDDTLTLTLVVNAAARSEVVLPGSAATWLPRSVSTQGKALSALRLSDAGELVAALEKGVHTLVLKGNLRGTSVQIPLGQKAHRADIEKTAKWTVEGVSKEGVPENTLQLTRLQNTSREDDIGAEQNLDSFVIVERMLSLDLNWTVTTNVRRLSPLGTAVVISVPLLESEQVTSDNVRVENQKALVNLSANQKMISWKATLKRFPTLKLVANPSGAFSEVWKVQAAAMWHVESKGIAPIHGADSGVKEWRPWPGESVELGGEKPMGAKGQTLTIDESTLSFSPGQRATDATLKLSMRSSRGDHHKVKIPKGATLTSFKIDGKTQPPRQDKDTVKIPLVPGAQQVELQWRQNESIRTRYTSPRVDLGVPSVNSHVEVKPGAERWVLMVSGPSMGPAVLLWALLIVLIALAAFLSREKDALPSMGGWILLGIGLSQVHIVLAALVAGWLLVFAWRKRSNDMGVGAFNLRQMLIAAWTFVALIILVFAVGKGLLGQPEMQIRGNASSQTLLRWTVDRTTSFTAETSFVSLPAIVYRGMMLLWSLWLSFALVGWLKKGWAIFAEGELWRRSPKKKSEPKPERGASTANAASSKPVAPLSIDTETVQKAAPTEEDDGESDNND